MYQIDNSTAAATQPASTTPGTAGWFTDGSVGGGVAPTVVPAEWLNAVQAELCNLVTAAGGTLTKNAFSQVAQAIQSCLLNTAPDTGTANTYACAFKPTISALTDGLKLSFEAAHANTGASTLNVNGIGAKPILGAAHAALQGGEIIAGGKIQVVWSAALSAFVLLEQTGGAQQVAAATESEHAMQLGQATGRLLNVQVFATAGTYTYTPTAGTTRIRVKVMGGGGAGGGTPSTTSGQVAIGGAGGAGGYAESLLTSGFSGASVVVGAAGVGASNANGGNGGTSSFGAFITCGGGIGGTAGTVTTTATGTTPAPGGTASGGNLLNLTGNIGAAAFIAIVGGTGSGTLGYGASTPYGSCIPSGSAVGNGSSGAGNSAFPSTGAAKAGLNGAPGIVIVEEYA